MVDDKLKKFNELYAKQDPNVKAAITEIIDMVSANQELTQEWAKTGEAMWKTLPSEISGPLSEFSKGPMVQSATTIRRLGRAENLNKAEVDELLARMKRMHEQTYFAIVGFLLTLAISDS